VIQSQQRYARATARSSVGKVLLQGEMEASWIEVKQREESLVALMALSLLPMVATLERGRSTDENELFSPRAMMPIG